jgi:biopolymer transport protein ExbB
VVEGILAEGAVLEFIQLQLFEKGGLVMLLIGVLSIIAAVIVIERMLYFRGRGADEEKLLKGLSDTLEKGLLDQAKGVCDQFHAPLASLISAGITRVHERKESAKELRDYLLETASLEIPKEERFLSALGTIAHIAPLLGLLGTVTGNIRAFGVLGELGAITDPALLSRGISEALLTTAAGIIVSIPAIIFYNFLVNKVNHRIIRLESRAAELASLLIAANKAAGSVPRAASNGNGALHGPAASGAPNGVPAHAPPAATVVEHAPARIAPVPAPAPAAPAQGHPGMIPIVATAAAPPVEQPALARPAPAAHAPPAMSPQAGLAPQAAPAYAVPSPVAPGQVGAVAPTAPNSIEAAPVHAAVGAPGQFDAVPRPAPTVPTHAHAVPTRVAAFPAQVEAVPAT